MSVPPGKPWFHSVQSPNTEQNDFELGAMIAFVEVLEVDNFDAVVVTRADAQVVASQLSAVLQDAARRQVVGLPPGLEPDDLVLTPDLPAIWWSSDESPVFRSRPQTGPPIMHTVFRLILPDELRHPQQVGSPPPRLKYDLLRDYIKEFYKGTLPQRVTVAGRRAQVTSVLPEFLTPAANGSSGSGGGPGSLPCPLTHQIFDKIAAHLGEPADQCIPRVRFSPSAGSGPNIDVALQQAPNSDRVIVLILDTAPDMARIQNPGVNTRVDNNPLLKKLQQQIKEWRTFVPITQLWAKPFEERADGEIPNEDTGKPYAMSDHGLFIAGLIHDVAPNAELRLWRVLNHLGLAELSTVFAGLAAALAEAQKERRPVVVNLSLVINAPVEDWVGDEPEEPSWGPEVGQALRDALEKTISHHLSTKCVLVAAAGNGSDSPAERREPRYPARFDSLISVASATCARANATVGNGGRPADYADCGDEASTIVNGVATFGGEAQWASATAGETRRVVTFTPLDTGTGAPELMPDAPIGIFISATVPEADEFSQPVANETGWVAWSGSSFATPIVTGLAARLWLDGDSSEDVIDKVMALATDATTELTVATSIPTPPGLKVKGIRAYQLRTLPIVLPTT